MNTRTVVIIVAVVLVLCIIGGICAVCAATGLLANWWDGGLMGGGAPVVGETAPDFQVETIEGDVIRLSEYRGRPVMINFWATWCPPCVEEMPLLQNRYEEHYPDLVIIAIEDGAEMYEVQEFAAEKGLTFLVARDNGYVQQQYGIMAFPTSFFIDADGVLQSQVVGSLSGSHLDNELAKIGLDN